jgi:hypothetical protein
MKQQTIVDPFLQSSELSKINRQAGEKRTNISRDHPAQTTAGEDQCCLQTSSQQQDSCDTSKRSLLIIPVSDFAPVTAEPAISWAMFGPDYSGNLPQRMRAPSS